MEKTKKRFLAPLLALVVLFSLCLCACTDDPNKVDKDECRVLAQSSNGSLLWEDIDVDDYFAGSTLLDAFTDPEDSRDLRVTLDDPAADSPMVAKIMGLNPDTDKNEYIAIYSNDLSLAAAEEYRTTKKIKKVTYYSVGMGIKDLPIKGKTVYLFCVETWQAEE